MQLDLEHSSLASQLLGLVLLGEGHVHVELLAGSVANNLLLETGDKAAGTQNQAVMLGLAALKGDAIHKALEVDISGIAILSLAIAGNDAAVAVLHAGQLGIHISVLNSIDLLGGL